MTKTVFKNTAAGPRGVRGGDGEIVMIDRGASIAVDDVSKEELQSAKDSGDFEIGGKADAAPEVLDDNGDPPRPEDITGAGAGARTGDSDAGDGSDGPLGGSITALKEHLETLDDVAALDALGKEEAAGKNRSGALAAIQARRDVVEPPAPPAA